MELAILGPANLMQIIYCDIFPKKSAVYQKEVSETKSNAKNMNRKWMQRHAYLEPYLKDSNLYSKFDKWPRQIIWFGLNSAVFPQKKF